MKNFTLLLTILCVSFTAFASNINTTLDKETLITRDTIPKDSIINNIPIISLSESELEPEDQFENISGLLTASNDLFANTAAFNFGVARFRIRGYDNNATQVYINGSSMNDLETGGTYWSLWGGLNDVFRNREASIGLSPTSFGFGGLNGATNIDIGAASQRKQKRISYASSNRSYFHRIMAVYTPELKNDWFFTVSGSRRWAKEGYVEGTSYDAWSYFLGVEKKFNGGKHSLAFNTFAAPNQRGRNSASVLEMYELAGTNYYNPNWGYQNGKKRNARVNSSHQPVMVLNHKWKINENSDLSTSASYQFGRNGGTALDWNGANDPRPDFYRKLPSYAEDPRIAQETYDAMKSNQDYRQINWQNLYNTNYLSAEETIENANGIDGNSYTGVRSKYIVEDRRYDRKKADFNINYNTTIGEYFTINSGAFYRRQNTHNHKRVSDLLGGDFYLDVNRFASRDFPGDDDKIQNDLNTPNKVLEKGDVFGYSYDSNISSTGAWVQGQVKLDKVDVFAAVNAGYTQYWRTGNFRNGIFPENSFGDSEKQNFLEYGAKVGATYKLNGRNYLFANGTIMARPPSFRDSYLSPRTRNQVLDGLTTEKIKSIEGGYYLKSPYYKARITGYYTKFQDGVDALTFFNDGTGILLDNEGNDILENSFGTLGLSGIDKQHFGIEIAAEAQVVTGLYITAAAAIGQYTYTSRPDAVFTIDNRAITIPLGKVYQKNFYVNNTPQRAYSVGLKYNSPKFWFANVTFNYFDEMYMNFNPLRRTEDGVSEVDPSTITWDNTIAQEELKNQYTLDLFGGKSWRFDYKYYIYITVGVSNVLNNRKFATGGYEQLRYEPNNLEKFPSKYYFAYGINYFAQVAFRF